jgi:EmrB/QacA subfamily drug resistance transporter
VSRLFPRHAQHPCKPFLRGSRLATLSGNSTPTIRSRKGLSLVNTTANPRTSLTLVIIAMTIGNGIILSSQTAVPLALPSIMSGLGVGSATVQWVLTAGLLPLAGLMVLGGRLGDLYGLRRVFISGAVLFAISSLAAAAAPSFELLVTSRVIQGAAGALLLPTSVAIVSAAATKDTAGRALGTLGGAAAVAGALGPILGGGLTGAFGWRAVMLINFPIAVLACVTTLIAVPRDPKRGERARVDILGASLLCVALVGIVFGVTQSQAWGWTSPGVMLPLAAAASAGVLFVLVERKTRVPLLDFQLLARHRNYAGATISQGLSGMVEMGLGIIFPLLLILNHGMSPTLAGLALLPTTLPMVIVAPLAGRWYDRVGGRIPLITGFGILAASAIALMWAADQHNFGILIPGLFLYGLGLALVLTVNDPVSLDSVAQQHHGQASGVSATAEQFGGALGIALFYLVMHSAYVSSLHSNITASNLPNLTDDQYAHLRDALISAEQTGLDPTDFPAEYKPYLDAAFDASAFGYSVAFACVLLVCVLGVVSSAILVRRVTPTPGTEVSTPERVFATMATVGSATNNPRE